MNVVMWQEKGVCTEVWWYVGTMRPVLGITNTSPAAPRTRWLGLVARGGVLLRRRIYPTLLGLRVALGGGGAAAGLPHGLRCTHHR